MYNDALLREGVMLKFAMRLQQTPFATPFAVTATAWKQLTL